ncbi:MAG TPA: (Fe-S)-binding protein [Desulfosporosinus sp.]|nr:(Fe-S)-binding protein [Desulfosporosinus sp.]
MGINFAEEMQIPTFKEKPKAEYCYFMGCKSRFDEAAHRSAIGFMSILNNLGVNFAVIEEEWCCGEKTRKLGDETLFKMLAIRNIRCFENAGIKKIITTCPICLKILKNDYHRLGGDFEVIAQADFLDDLIHKRKLQMITTNNFDLGLCHSQVFC